MNWPWPSEKLSALYRAIHSLSKYLLSTNTCQGRWALASEFFRSTLKHEVWLSSQLPSFPVISHSPGFVILKISSKSPVLSRPDSHKSLGNCPNSLAPLSATCTLSEPPCGSQHHLAQVLLVSTSPAFSSKNSFCSVLEVLITRILKLQVVPSSSPN